MSTFGVSKVKKKANKQIKKQMKTRSGVWAKSKKTWNVARSRTRLLFVQSLISIWSSWYSSWWCNYNNDHDDYFVGLKTTCDRELSQWHLLNRCQARTLLLRLDPPTWGDRLDDHFNDDDDQWWSFRWRWWSYDKELTSWEAAPGYRGMWNPHGLYMSPSRCTGNWQCKFEHLYFYVFLIKK